MKISKTAIVTVAVLLAAPSLAQSRHARPRIEVTPSDRYYYYRACVDGYRLVPRPAWGETVIMPYMHCRWVHG